MNGYARLIGIAGTTMFVEESHDMAASFVAGKSVVVMQMQDDVHTYNFGENSSVQAITFEPLGGAGDLTTITALAALPWNGLLGGVRAVEVECVQG